MRLSIVLLALTAFLASCGVKSDLQRPDGKPVSKDQGRDPSRPPSPLGR